MPTIDPRNILTGRDGELYDEDGNFLAQVPEFQCTITFENTDYQPAGSLQKVKVLTGYTVALTMTETHIKDDLMARVLSDIKAGRQPNLSFQGVLRGHNGSTGRYVLRQVVPDGDADLFNVRAGDVISRAWNWAVNDAPDLQSLLTA